MKDIEADGYITRDCDLTPERRTCANCRWYQYSLIIKDYACVEGHKVTPTDWRQKYGVCDKWKRI